MFLLRNRLKLQTFVNVFHRAAKKFKGERELLFIAFYMPQE
jgi:hypothetical protein